MTPENYQLAQQWFLQLRELEVKERQHALADLSGRDASLGQLVIELLAADDHEFLEPKGTKSDQPSPLPQLLETQTHSESESEEDSLLPTGSFAIASGKENANDLNDVTPKRIGDYRILQKIAEGGHGVVFMAEQMRPVRRKVALKRIKPGMESKQILARFDAERQALAMMNHPSIANVFDASTTENGQPYFVMELVHGMPIDQFCEKNSLPIRERLDLFRQVCDAVHHAHRKGIIHRDLKPGNVLVTIDSGKPLAKVIDFGIAKAMHSPLTDQTMFTQFGQIVGTLEYMSPEQAVMSNEGPDVRSDVYSLGVLLYRLLTGTTPISRQELLKKGIWEIRNVLSDFQPTSPSLRITEDKNALSFRDQTKIDAASKVADWQKQLRGDLDWITMKALSKEANLRYDSAAAFADDIENYLEELPVDARAPSRWYRFSKFIQRNRVSVVFASTLAVCMTAAVIALAFGYWQSQQNLVALQQATQRANEYAHRMAEINNRRLLEFAWEKSQNGDPQAAWSHLNDVPDASRSFVWNFVNQVRQQSDWNSLTDESAGAIRVASIDGKNQLLVVVRADATLELWDLASREQRASFPLQKGVYASVSLSTDGTQALVGGNHQLLLIDLKRSRIIASRDLQLGGIRDSVHDPIHDRWHISTGSNYLVSVDESLGVLQRKKLPGRLGKIFQDEQYEHILVSELQGSMYLLEATDWSELRTISGANTLVVDCLWNRDSIALLDQNGARYELKQNELLQNDVTDFQVAPDESSDGLVEPNVSAVAFDFQGNRIVGDRDGFVYLIDEQQQLDIPIRRFGSAIKQVDSSANGEVLVVHRNSRINVIDGADIACRRAYVEGLKDVTDGACLADQDRTITSHLDGTIKLWATTTGEQLRENQTHRDQVLSVDVHERKQLLASVGTDWQLTFADLDTLKPQKTISIGFGVRPVQISYDGEQLAAAAERKLKEIEGTVQLYDTATQTPGVLLRGHSNWVIEMEFFDNDRKLITNSVDGTARVWSTETGEQLSIVDHQSSANVTAMEAIHGTERVAFAHVDGSISIWDSSTGQQIIAVSKFGDRISGLIAPRGSDCLIAAAENDTQLTFLTLDRLKTLGQFDVGVGSINSVKCDRQDRRMQILGNLGAVRIWDLPINE
ncbi:MAG: serine/threonine-protein kinase [Planctomycetota bacterium]